MSLHKTDFASHLFDRSKMKKFLASWAYREICDAQNNASETSPCISQKSADNFAKGLKKWALSLGATRFTHWFQPLNNFTAGKRDSLFSVDAHGRAVEKFRGKELLKGESDASSFPSGGLRQTFEARGLTNWDCLSAPFVTDGCLFVPTTFTGFSGEALDKKTPLIRSLAALNKQAVRLMRLCGFDCRRVTSVVGAEQEYFLVDKEKFLRRADLHFTGRTLVGAMPPKGQELFDHYYRLPNAKIVAFWQEVDRRLWQLGIVAKTEHKEVAPNQFELAPCYAAVNVACDQNQIAMLVLERVAEKFNLVCLLHEKPFEHFNGSGKHNNWSLLTDDGTNLFESGKTPAEKARFSLFLAAVVRAVDLHQDLFRFAVAGAGNDRRLGGFEAPPQTVSVFLGNPNGSTDRNRTSPFAFTGNKFEFRTVGSSASLADCNTILNTTVAESLHFFVDELKKTNKKSPPNFWSEVQKFADEQLREHGRIVFNGNNYSEEWKQEAAARGLLNIPNAFLAVKCLTDKKNTELFAKNKVFSPRELAAMQQVFWETYADSVCLETKVTALCLRQIVCSVQKYLDRLLQIAQKKRRLKVDGEELSSSKQIAQIADELQRHIKHLNELTIQYKSIGDAYGKAEFAAATLNPAMDSARKVADLAETVCPPELWPMPTYGELLFSL